MAGTWILGVICFLLILSTTGVVFDETGIVPIDEQKYPWQFKCQLA